MLHTYTGDKLYVLGSREVNIDNQSQHYELPVRVVAGKSLNLLSRNRLNVIKLDWTQMFYLKEGNGKQLQRRMTDKYSEVLYEEFGSMKGQCSNPYGCDTKIF